MININELSSRYKVQRLGKNNRDEVLVLMKGNPLYFQYCPPSPTEELVIADMMDLPPGKSYNDKYYLGIFDNNKLIAVLDFVLAYPDELTCFIGFFMVDRQYQARNIGTFLISEIIECLYSNGYQYVRLGYVKDNPQAKAFWLKNGFMETGIEKETKDYTIVVLQRNLNKKNML